jgi:hypothetical protein
VPVGSLGAEVPEGLEEDYCVSFVFCFVSSYFISIIIGFVFRVRFGVAGFGHVEFL